MYNAIIIDDERKSIELLEWQISNYCPSIKVVATCDSSADGIEAIEKHKPDIVFLDIEMPVMNGFELLEQFTDIAFSIIFTTSYDQYAIKAIRFSALDYLLKPIDANDLKAAVAKLEVKLSKNEQTAEVNQSQPAPNNTHRKRIALTTNESLIFVEPEKILFCESSSNYTYFYLTENDKKILISKTLKDIEEILVKFDFFRIHNSHLVNMKHVKEFIRGSGGYVVMANGSHLTVSKTRKEEFFNMFSKI